MPWDDEDREVAEALVVAEGLTTAIDSPYDLGTKGFWVVQDVFFDRFMATRDDHLAELHELTAETGGPALDGTPESLGPLEAWWKELLRGPFADGSDWYIAWRGREDPVEILDNGWSRAASGRMRERIALYYAEVAMAALPGSQWVCWRSKASHDIAAGDFALDVGAYPARASPLSAVGFVRSSILDSSRDPADPEYEPVQVYSLDFWLGAHTERREEYLSTGKKLNFQKAPTGPEAGKGRGPYKGRRESEMRIKMGWT
jgi:hypothetical protein